MNTRLGKSFGLAFVVAVGILALMFALGTFNAQNAGAAVKSNPAPTATLLDADGDEVTMPGEDEVSLIVTFQINDDIDGAPTADQADDDVTITVPATISVIGTDFDVDNITVTQNGDPVGKVVDPIATAQQIVITVADEGDDPVVRDETVTVTISDLTLADDAISADLTIAQTGQTTAQTASLAIYDPDNALSGLSATLSNTEVEAEDVTLTLEFTTPEDATEGGATVVITLPKEYDVFDDGSQRSQITVTSSADGAAATLVSDDTADATAEAIAAGDPGDTITLASADIDPDTDYTVTVGATAISDGTPTAGFTNPESAGTFTVKFRQGNVIPAGEAMFAVVKTPPVTASVTSSKTTADTATRLTIDSPGETLGDIGPGDQIVINVPKFGLPSSIDTEDVTIDDGDRAANPSEVTISGDNVSLVLGKFADEVIKDGERETVGNKAEENRINKGDTKVTITIRERAGIKTPTKAGDYPVKVDGKDADDKDGYDIGGDDSEDAMNPMITIVRSLSVKPESAVRGTEITITGKGFTDGGSTVKAGDKTIGTPTIENGSFELKLNNNFKVGSASAFVKGDEGTDINVTDGAGDEVETPANHTIKATFTIAPESPNPGEEITITLLDIDGSSVNVKFAGEPATGVEATVVNATAGTWKVRVPSDVSPGVVQMTVEVDDDDENQLNKNVTIATNALTVSPSTALVGQEVTVTGSGFTVGEEISDLEIGGVSVLDQIALTARGVASGGRVVAAFRIPNDGALSEARDYTISIKDGTRTGTGTVTIPERTLTVDPAASRIGTTISLSGTNWPTGTGANLVGIYYDGNRYNTATSNSSGSWSASLTVPNDAGVGMTHKVAAKATVGDGGTANVTEEEDHKTPDPVVTLSSGQAQRGTTITVSGENFNIFEVVTIEIGDSDVTPGGTTTDGVGSFSVSVLVPGQALGNKNLKVTVKGVPVVEFLEIVATPVSTTKSAADVFEPLSTAGILTVVWHFDNDTKAWSFYDPRPAVAAAVDLTMVSTGDNVWIQVTADMDFQGESLTTGWNLHTLK